MTGLISMGSEIVECDDLPQSGTRDRIVLINFADVTKIYTNDDGKIVEILLKSSTSGGIELDAELDAEFGSDTVVYGSGYVFTGFRNDVKKSDEVVKREKSNKRFKHNVGFVIYDLTQAQKNNIRNLVRGRVLAIVENKGRDADSIEVLGKECGLQIVGGPIRNAHEDGGFFIINLATPDNGVELERKLPQTLGISYEHGLSLIDILTGDTTVPPVGEGIFVPQFDQTFE